MILEKCKDHISDVCLAHEVRFLYAFGSILTDHFNADSDIDLIVDFEPMGISNYADNYYELKFSLENMFQKPIDLLEEKAIKNPYFRQVIDKQRQLIYMFCK